MSGMLIAIAVVVGLFILMKVMKGDKSEATQETATPSAKPQAAAPTPAAATAASADDEVMTVIAAAIAASDADTIAVITAAVVAAGYSAEQIASVRPRIARQWTLESRLSGRRI